MKVYRVIGVVRHDDMKHSHEHKHGEYAHEHSHEEQAHEHTHQHEGWDDAQGDTIDKALAAMKGYKDYVNEHGGHFTDKLATWASDHMINAHGEPTHHWSVEDVKSAFGRFGLTKPDNVTWGDITYAANMHYADYSGITLKTEPDCLRQAYADAADPDGYPEKIFNRWCADVIGKRLKIDWEKYL